jgi:riboflavin kinase/FMN adenylyltransferase
MKANKMLLIPYYIYGKVIHGKHFGSKLGFKTANVKINNDLISPKSGSYLGYTIYDGKKYESAIFIRNGIVESHLLKNFNKNIYDKKIIILPLIFTHAINKAKNFNDLKRIITMKINEIKKLFEM